MITGMKMFQPAEVTAMSGAGFRYCPNDPGTMGGAEIFELELSNGNRIIVCHDDDQKVAVVLQGFTDLNPDDCLEYRLGTFESVYKVFPFVNVLGII